MIMLVEGLTRLVRILLGVTLLVSLLPGPKADAGAVPDPATSPTIDYVSPSPGSDHVSEMTNIIVRPGGMVDGTTVAPGRVQVTGALSGPHSGKVRLSDDRQTLTFDPDLPFLPGEIVTCTISSGLKTDKKGDIPPEDFTFTVAGPERAILNRLPGFGDGEEETTGGVGPLRVDSIPPPPPTPPLPPDFPSITASVFGATAPGRLFLANLNLGRVTASPFLMILDNSGVPFFQRRTPALALDFKMQPDGRLTYFDTGAKCFYALDAHYAVVDSFRCGNGYATDGHELVLLPNGHALLMSYDPEVVDLTSVRPGLGFGIAIGLVIQELDSEKEVVFQWRSWDHFKLTDSIGSSFFGGGFDYVHGNSIDADANGDIIISCRSMDEVTKISRATGEILWRLGGKNNQFTFVGDPTRFTHQHDVRWLPNGHLTMFDNGNFRVPPYSRAVEYVIDETQMAATMVWEHRHTPDVFGPALGSVQRFANGNTLICWGATNPTLTEVAPDGSTVLEVTFPPGTSSYRGLRFEWPPVRPASITFKPASIRKGSTGTGPLQAVIEPVASDFDVSDIDLSTVLLGGTVRAETAQFGGDGNGDGIPDVTVTFPRAAVDLLVSVGTNTLEVSGSLATGAVFRGSAPLRVVAPSSLVRSGSVELVSAPGALPVELAAGKTSGARTFAIYDIQGRLVRRWRSSARRATWDGNRSDGTRASAGVYFVRTEDGAPGETTKLVIVR